MENISGDNVHENKRSHVSKILNTPQPSGAYHTHCTESERGVGGGGGVGGDESTALMSLRECASHRSRVERIFLSRRVARLQVCAELENLSESQH